MIGKHIIFIKKRKPQNITANNFLPGLALRPRVMQLWSYFFNICLLRDLCNFGIAGKTKGLKAAKGVLTSEQSGIF